MSCSNIVLNLNRIIRYASSNYKYYFYKIIYT